MNANPTLPNAAVRSAILDCLKPLVTELEHNVYYGSLADVAFSVVRTKNALDGILSTFKMDVERISSLNSTKYPDKNDLYTVIANEIKDEVEAWGRR